MTVTYQNRTVIKQDVPSGLLTLTLPPGISLDKWVKMETARIEHQYPSIKEGSVELGAETEEIFRICKAERDTWNIRYEVAKLHLREDLGYAKRGLANGIPFIERRITSVSDYHVDAYEQDALYPI